MRFPQSDQSIDRYIAPASARRLFAGRHGADNVRLLWVRQCSCQRAAPLTQRGPNLVQHPPPPIRAVSGFCYDRRKVRSENMLSRCIVGHLISTEQAVDEAGGWRSEVPQRRSETDSISQRQSSKNKYIRTFTKDFEQQKTESFIKEHLNIVACCSR